MYHRSLGARAATGAVGTALAEVLTAVYDIRLAARKPGLDRLMARINVIKLRCARIFRDPSSMRR